MNSPLADRIRPKTLDDVVGQRHILGHDKILRKIIDSGSIPNMVFYGPSGVGKTTIASIIAEKTNKYLCKLNGTTASTADIKAVVAQTNTINGMNGVLLYLDEIQYFNKKQQQTLLEFIENGSITLIASTAENPYFYVYKAILSRSTVFEFKAVNDEDIEKAVLRAFKILEEEQSVKISFDENVPKYISTACAGDVRKAMNAAELCALTASISNDGLFISMESARMLAQKSAMRYDRDGDEHYDILSAFQKSMRGSDVNAALHYLARLLVAGDLPSACRRLMVCACEDVGLAWPNIIPIVKAAVDAALMVGLPEAKIPLADAVILVAQAPKSNSGDMAISKAMADIENGLVGPIPRCLQNKHYDGDDVKNKGQFYKYPHDFENRWVKQQYLPDNLVNAVYYEAGDNKSEQGFEAYWKNIRK